MAFEQQLFISSLPHTLSHTVSCLQRTPPRSCHGTQVTESALLTDCLPFLPLINILDICFDSRIREAEHTTSVNAYNLLAVSYCRVSPVSKIRFNLSIASFYGFYCFLFASEPTWEFLCNEPGMELFSSFKK